MPTAAEVPRVTWAPWGQLENLFRAEGIPFKLVKGIPLSRVDVVRSRANKARPSNPLSRDRVDTIKGMAGLAGLVLHPLVAVDGRAGLLDLLDGNHRYAAVSELGEEEGDFYIVGPVDEKTREWLTRQINMLVGEGPTYPDRLDAAVYAARRRAEPHAPSGKDIAWAAGLYIVGVQAVRQRIRLAEVRDQLGPDGTTPVPGSSRLGDAVVLAAAGAQDPESVRALVACLVNLATIPDTESISASAEFIKKALKSSGQAAAQEEAAKAVKAFRELAAVRAGRGTAPVEPETAGRVIMKSMKQLVGHLSSRASAGTPIATMFGEQKDLFVVQARAVRARLGEMIRELTGVKNGDKSAEDAAGGETETGGGDS